VSLLLGGRSMAAVVRGGVPGGTNAAAAGSTAAAAAELAGLPGRVYVPFSLSMRQLKHVSTLQQLWLCGAAER
jgi:hypothetical protein